MLTGEMERLRALAEPGEYEAGVALQRRGMVMAAGTAPEGLHFWVGGAVPDRWRVTLAANGAAGGHCGCPACAQDRPCRHIVAATLYAEGGGLLAGARDRRAVEAGVDLLRAMEPRLPLEAELRLEPLLHLRRDAQGRPALSLALRVGTRRLYVVRDIRRFLEDIAAGVPVVFGKGFTLQSAGAAFAHADARLLALLREAAESKGPAATGKWLALTPPGATRTLRLLAARPFRLAMGEQVYDQERVWSGALPVRMTVRGSGPALRIEAELPATARALTADCEFVFCEGGVLRPPKEQRPLLGVLFARGQQGFAEFRFPAGEAARAVSELLPRLMRAGEVQFDDGVARRIVRAPLEATVHLDREGRGVVARVAFRYGEWSVDPFEAGDGDLPALSGAEGLLLMRDAHAEQRVLDVLSVAGFRVRLRRACLMDAEDLARFFVQGVHALQNVAQVYCSVEFKRLAPRKPRLIGTLRMAAGGLALQITEDGEPVESLLPLMEALRAGHRYYLLREGAMLDLSAMAQWLPLAEALHEERLVRETKRMEGAPQMDGHPAAPIMLAGYRAAQLADAIRVGGLPVDVSEDVRRMVQAIGSPDAACPTALEGVLRPYQRRGFAWLRALWQARMGGILADDMGLGKTVQVIALTLWIRQNDSGSLPALVVAPSSLVYNWQMEYARYAPQLKTQVLEGPQAARVARIRALPAEPPDVLIVSYPLVRRDIAALEGSAFSLVVLDEAQYIKNAASVGASAVRRLRGDARFVLTGTPMENHPGELWSLMDFVLPGYLGPLPRFMHHHGAGQGAEELRSKIGPFLLRRLKRDVLRDLPEKMETRLLAEMTQEQRRVYRAALLRLSREVDALLSQKGLARGRMEALAVLTELRQICCHPALCMPEYPGSSGKLDLLTEVLPGALEAGHRVLLFSQFTSMLRLLQRRLAAMGVDCLYLDGDTPSKERPRLVRRFNEGEGQVFLISLRAGGAGLNLTGADMVIHYDPWWNPAAEDQATDRAHRIGQTRAVQVIRLITRHSVEEQVAQLSERKRALFDAMVDGGTQAAARANEEELLALLRHIAGGAETDGGEE